MKKIEELSIRSYEERADKISYSEFSSMRRKMINQLPLPKLEIKDQYVKANPGEKVSIPVRDYPIPGIDLYNGKLISARKSRKKARKVIVTFNGLVKPIRTKALFRSRKKAFDIQIPKDAEPGLVTFTYPVEISIEGIRPEFRKDIFEIPGIDKMCPGEPPEKGIISLVTTIGFAHGYLKCIKCRHNSICPHGAIKFDENYDCYVDPEICIGRKATKMTIEHVNGRSLNKRLNEEVCWECMLPDEDGQSKCTATMVKYMYLDPTCCGCCVEFAQREEGECLSEACPEEIISVRSTLCARCPSQGTDGEASSYIVDTDLCTGCEECYHDILCNKVQMKARIVGDREVLVVVTHVKFKHIFIPEWIKSEIPDIDPFSWKIGCWSQHNHKPEFREIPIDLNGPSEIPLYLTMPVNGDVHFAIYRKARNGSMIPMPGKGYVYRPSMKTLNTRVFDQRTSSSLDIPTQFGTFKIEYTIEPVRNEIYRNN